MNLDTSSESGTYVHIQILFTKRYDLRKIAFDCHKRMHAMSKQCNGTYVGISCFIQIFILILDIGAKGKKGFHDGMYCIMYIYVFRIECGIAYKHSGVINEANPVRWSISPCSYSSSSYRLLRYTPIYQIHGSTCIIYVYIHTYVHSICTVYIHLQIL